MIRLRAIVTLPRHEKRKDVTDHGTYETVYHVANQPATLVLEIDDLALLRTLGRNAAKSKRGVSVLGGGAIRVLVVERNVAVPVHEATPGFGAVRVLERKRLDHDPMGEVQR